MLLQAIVAWTATCGAVTQTGQTYDAARKQTTVTATGVAPASGSCTVTAASGGKSAKFTVAVLAPLARGLALGPFNAGFPCTPGTLCLNANSPANLKAQLAAAEAGGYQVCAVPTGGKHDQYITLDHWDLAKWKAKVEIYRSDSAVWRKYARSGALACIDMIDEPQCSSCWGGKSVPWVTVDQAAAIAEQIFPETPIRTRTNATQFAGYRFQHLDGGMLQYSWDFGNVATFASAQIAAAKAIGVTLLVGVNAENGGTLVSGCLASVTRPGECRMSPAELSRNFRALMQDTVVVCGGTFWLGDVDQAGSYFAVKAVSDTVASLARWAKTRPRPKCHN